MESSSGDGEGPSTTGGRSERPQHWDFVPGVVTKANAGMAQRKVFASARKCADDKLRGTGLVAVVTAIENPRSKRQGRLQMGATDADGASRLLFAIKGEGSQAGEVPNGGTDPKKTNIDGISPLQDGAGRGYCEIDDLLSKEANVDPICQYGEALPHVAARHEHARMLELLPKHNPNAGKHGCLTDEALHAKRNLCHMYNRDQQNSQATSSICKTALYCAISWLMMKMGIGDSSPTLLCAHDFSVMDTLMLYFSCTLDTPTFLCSTDLPMTDINLVEYLDLIDKMEVSNRATICLDQSDDGTEYESLKSVRGGIGAIRAWCFKYGLRFDVSRVYGPNLVIYTTPAGGTFYLTIKHLERAVTLLLAGRNLYIKGWRDGLHGAFELTMETETSYMLGNVRTIPIQENYRFLSPDTSVGKTWMGPGALRFAFETLYKCQGKRSWNLKRAIGIFAVHIAEAARIQCVLRAECRSFLDYNQATLDGTPEHHSGSVLQQRKNSFWVNEYGHCCNVSMADTQHQLDGTVSPGIEHQEDGDVASIEIFREIRIILRDACEEGTSEKKPPMVEDPDDQYNRMILSSKGLKAGMKRSRPKQERGGQRKKRRLHELSVGGDGNSHLIALLLEDWLPQVDKEEVEIEEEEKEADEDQAQEIKEETDEEQVQEIKEETDEEQGQEIREADEQADASHGDFLSHFPAIKKFIERQLNQVRPVERMLIQPFTTTLTPIPRSMDVVSSVRHMQMSTEEDILFSLRAKMRSRSRLLQRPSRVVPQPCLLKAGHFVGRIFRFRFVF